MHNTCMTQCAGRMHDRSYDCKLDCLVLVAAAYHDGRRLSMTAYDDMYSSNYESLLVQYAYDVHVCPASLISKSEAMLIAINPGKKFKSVQHT